MDGKKITHTMYTLYIYMYTSMAFANRVNKQTYMVTERESDRV